MCFFFFSVLFQSTAGTGRTRYESSCRRVRESRRISTLPVWLLRKKEKKRENISYLLQQKGPQPWINVCTGSTRKQRILGYLKAWSTPVNRPGLSLQQRGLAWLRPAICQLIMPVGPDRREEPLLKRASFHARITLRLPKNLICSYGC